MKTHWMWIGLLCMACSGDKSTDDETSEETGDDDDVTGDDDDDDDATGFDPVGMWEVTNVTFRNVETTTTTGGKTGYQTGYGTYDYADTTGELIISFRDDGTFDYVTYYTQETDTSASRYYGTWTWEVEGDQLVAVLDDYGYTQEWNCTSAAPYDVLSCDIYANFDKDPDGEKYGSFVADRL